MCSRPLEPRGVTLEQLQARYAALVKNVAFELHLLDAPRDSLSHDPLLSLRRAISDFLHLLASLVLQQQGALTLEFMLTSLKDPSVRLDEVDMAAHRPP